MNDEYDKEQLRILRNAFKAFDHDERGYIEHGDVTTILEILGQKLDEKATKALIKEVDRGNSGRLDFSQFCRLAARFVEVEEDANALANELKEAFRVYDKEGKGYLTVQVLRDILRELDDKLSKDDLDMIIEEIDADGSGTVDFDEFMQVMTGKNVYDLTVERRFVFEPRSVCVSIAPTAPVVPPVLCHCTPQRKRLHRRIEWHFERLFDQLWRPLSLPKFILRPAITLPPKTSTTTTTTTTASSSSSSLSVNKHANSVKTAQVTTTSKKSCCNHEHVHTSKTITQSGSCCYRSIYRPRFPKWVPILTLYREIVQNPFKRRGRYLIEQY